ncbi:exodeoxyribonuclease III [Alternaria panax]|uniref:Exodeoxyribonuclease III n=1 Tax=Alternaria panax TaxID=48097 RepID=A0AAD4IGU4_9PLEO|nr:exodeoxyribonuclease III [Alternaria panax]
MTSLTRARTIRHSQTSIAVAYAACRQYWTMNRDISPSPAKRRKTRPSTALASQQTAPINTPVPVPPRKSHTLRIFSWNINGILPFLQKPTASFLSPAEAEVTANRSPKDAKPPASLKAFLYRHQWPSILFLQEVKIASTDKKTQDAIKAGLKSRLPIELTSSTERGPLYYAHFTLPTDTVNARGPKGSGRIYGVCSVVRRDLMDTYHVAFRTAAWDREGRVHVVEVKSRTSKAKLAIFNIYAVSGSENAYRDPSTGARIGTRHDRKREFHSLLMRECKELEEQGWDVLLAGDMNVALDERDGFPTLRVFPPAHVINRADFHEKLLEENGEEKSGGFNGVDVWRKMHEEERRYTYFSRGRKWGSSCDRVDYFIAGRKTWEKGCVKACGIMDSEEELGPSDHVPIWADFELEGEDEKQGE